MFIGIVATTAFLQVLIVQFGSIAFKVKDGGLSAELWGYSIMFGAIALLVKQIINVVVRIFLHCNGGANKGAADRRKKVEESYA
jgi:hypothetical protein